MIARTALLALLPLLVSTVVGQCPFTPTITPNNPVLCPNETATLTTQAYDGYQWYKDGLAIVGANGQSLTVQQFNDAGSSFTVAATLDACTESSAALLVDSWVFLFPYMIHGGDEPNSTGPNGEQVFCQGDTMTLTLGGSYTANITWYANGSPIPGAVQPELTVTTTGSYTASAAPAVCPNYVQGIGVEVEATFNAPIQPDIVPNGNELCAYPVGNSTQWYANGVPMGNTDCIEMDGPGPYTVFVDYGTDCQVISEPFFSTGMGSATPKDFSVSPVPATNNVLIIWSSELHPQGDWKLLDLTGREVMSGRFNGSDRIQLQVEALAPGNYLLAPVAKELVPVRVVVAR
ncbi:MAG: T9SS type A sorting domain-containing protein [Flavobacteriales bacterium]|nr:T9SS type A sorting domain-containing protein [Flavobacteriales bacterium]